MPTQSFGTVTKKAAVAVEGHRGQLLLNCILGGKCSCNRENDFHTCKGQLFQALFWLSGLIVIHWLLVGIVALTHMQMTSYNKHFSAQSTGTGR